MRPEADPLPELKSLPLGDVAETEESGSSQAYLGDELEIFAAARVWRRYVQDLVTPHLGPRVLEVGAGLGTRTVDLAAKVSELRHWLALELDREQAQALSQRQDLPSAVEVRVGSTDQLCAIPGAPEAGDRDFDAVLYLDVLEHIDKDGEELNRAGEQLAPGGRLIVLAPAHSWLYSPFDRAVGHHRRYDRASIRALKPRGMRLQSLRYVDSAGLLASAVNRFAFRTAKPSSFQIAIWDRILVRISRITDPLSLGLLGKSILAVWIRETSGESR
jgi:SAM-dependent methyltransferase